MKQLVKIVLLSIGFAFLTQPAFAESKPQGKDDGPAVVCKSVDENGKAMGAMEKMSPGITVGDRTARPCCQTPDGATCYAYNCSKCKTLCRPRTLPK